MPAFDANDTIVLGAGEVYFDIEDSSGNLTGERYLGDTPSFEITSEAENLESFSSDGEISQKNADVAIRVNRTAAVTIKNISLENLALFVIGATQTHNQAGASPTNENHTVLQGRYYQLGAGPTNLTGVRNVTSVVVTGSGGTPTHVLDTDYRINAELGQLFIIEGGGISDSTLLEVDYTVAAETREQLNSDDLGAKRGALRFIGRNSQGTNRDVYIPLITFAPTGALAFKSRDTFQEITFNGLIGIRGSNPQLIVDGRSA